MVLPKKHVPVLYIILFVGLWSDNATGVHFVSLESSDIILDIYHEMESQY